MTKSRPKPKAVRRRYPTRQHLRELATQSQMLPGIDYNAEIKLDLIRHNSLSSCPVETPKLVIDDIENNKKDSFNQKEISHSTTSKQQNKPAPSPRHKRLSDIKTNIFSVEASKTNSNLSDSLSISSNKSRSNLSLKDETKTTCKHNYGSGSQPGTLTRQCNSSLKNLELTDELNKTASLDRRNFNSTKKVNPQLANVSGYNQIKENLLKSKGFKLPGLTPGDSITPLKGKSKSTTVLNETGDLPSLDHFSRS